jgi:D-3-phosphoglycerate dehydrogenase / 2-oxoglutarate reductase
MKILANDGIDAAGKSILMEAGFDVVTDKIPQEELESRITDFDVIIVRSATKVTEKIIRASNLKLIARAGVGLDNIDLRTAGELGIPVVNTPNASSRSVAELVFAHAFSIARMLFLTNRIMPDFGKEQFKELKNTASAGFELTGKRMGIIGFGRIGQEVAKIAVGLGMEVLVYDYKSRSFDIIVELHEMYRQHNFKVTLKGQPLDVVLKTSDFISIHTPGSEEVIGELELSMMKKSAILLNCARGGVVNEKALNQAISDNKIAFAGVDVFENEPPVNDTLLKLKNTSLSPHIGASTAEAQLRVGIELAERIVAHLK